MKRKKRNRAQSLLAPTLDDIMRAPPADAKAMLNALSLGELLALTGLDIEVEREDATPEHNAEVTRLVKNFRPKQNQQ